jgi:hypothetical protein
MLVKGEVDLTKLAFALERHYIIPLASNGLSQKTLWSFAQTVTRA